MELSDITTTSVIEIDGTAVDTVMKTVKAPSLKYAVEKSDVTVESSVFTAAQMSVTDGSISYVISDSVDKTQITASSDTGSLLVNAISNGSPWRLDPEEHDKTLDIKSKTANINITYPITEKADEASDGANE